MQKLSPSVVVLISGRGSNLEALFRYQQEQGGFRIAAVLSNRPDAAGLQCAAQRGLPTQVVDHTRFETRDAFDQAMIQAIDEYQPALVALAGFMRILTPGFVAHYKDQLLNVHPSLLPAFKGLNTHQQAIDAGARVHGASVHWVSADLDDGPVLDQAVVPVLADDTAESLAARVLVLEHQLYPRVIAQLAQCIADGKPLNSFNFRVLPLLHGLGQSR